MQLPTHCCWPFLSYSTFRIIQQSRVTLDKYAFRTNPLNHSRATIMSQTEDLNDAPLLMIEGDEFYVNHDGVCRTFYELERWNNDILKSFGLEEEYDLQRAQKTFTLRVKSPYPQKDKHSDLSQQSSIRVLPAAARGLINIGTLHHQVQIQEIDQGVFGSAGTGATTWESSIAMALLLSSKPNLLHGHVLELGSGVGLGGILTGLMVGPPSILSLTLSDGNEEVLEACRENCRRANIQNANFHIRKLDWNALPKPGQKYDTILASDCAYKYPDIMALASACKHSLRESAGKIHIFGPYNRGGLHDLLHELSERQDMDVTIDLLEMSRYRLQSSRGTTYGNGCNQNDGEESMYASKHLVKFLHASVMHKSCLEGKSLKSRSQQHCSQMDTID